MRTFVSAAMAAIMISTGALAVPAGSLPPGQPAGIVKAQMQDNTVWWVLGLGVVAAGIALVASGGNNNALTSGTLGTTTTSATTTTTK